jgi:chlorobactene glucosyltransferase
VNPLLLSIPWILVLLYLVVFVRNPPRVPPLSLGHPGRRPFVSIIVPARNEELNIGTCLASLCGSDYPAFEILVVDDRSRDRTAEIVSTLSRENAAELTLIEGKPLPPGWFGKPWACWQGAEAAKGSLLLFTDADTVHGPDLLAQAVEGLEREGADAYTIIGRQIMGSFWEQVLQPQFFFLLAARYPGAGKPRKRRHWKHAIANGQYLLFKRDVYEKCGGHSAVAGEVVEDLRLAQLLTHGGWTLMVRGSEGLRTRMYRSLGGLVEGWSKNVTTAARQTTAPWLLPIILPLSALTGTTLWLIPPSVSVWSLATSGPGQLLTWGLLATGISVVIWVRVSILLRGNPFVGFLYPLGALVGLYIFFKSWRGGNRIRWKERDYQMADTPTSEPPGTAKAPGNASLSGKAGPPGPGEMPGPGS